MRHETFSVYTLYVERNQAFIKFSSLTADDLLVEYHSTLAVGTLVRLVAELVRVASEAKAHGYEVGENGYSIRIAFKSDDQIRESG